MPTLDWIGKSRVVNHHLDVPYHVLERVYSFDESGRHDGDNGSGNTIIHGDNLLALKSLLPQYEGRVKCIYIDPPYNTGNENWVYNDNVNDPRIKKWLGDVVGKEGEDLSRHDKWLCMMYPRLKLLQRLLAEDGAIFISIDDNERDNLKLVCNEIFGLSSYKGCIVRATGTTTGQDGSGLGSSFDYVLIYAKSKDFIFGGLPLTQKDLKRFENTDERGSYSYLQLRKTGSNDRREDRPNMYYAVKDPDGNDVYPIALAGYESRWRVEIKTYEKLVSENMILWKKIDRDGHEAWWPYVKYYAEGRTKRPSSLWIDIEGNKKASRDLKAIMGVDVDFDYPKPVEMIERIIRISANEKEAIILDSFAGTGTTAQAVLNLNKEDGGNRKFILVEMMDYAESITAERVKRVIAGYGEGKNAKAGTGGSFQYYELGAPLFHGETLNADVGEEELRRYVYFTETREAAVPLSAAEPGYLGTHLDVSYYFHYCRDAVTTLNRDFLHMVKRRSERYVVYADLCTISQEELSRRHIVFKKIPRDISRL